MRTRATLRLATLLGAVILSLGTFAQTQTAQESIDVTIVNIDVHVTDKQGKRVTGLRAGDFIVREEGAVQPITNFSEFTASTAETSVVESADPVSNPAAASAPITRPRRTIVLFVEPVVLTNFHAKELFDGMRALMRDAVAPGDRVSIVTFVRKMKVQLEFTDDLTRIEHILNELEKATIGVEGSPIHEATGMLEEEKAFDQEYAAALAAEGISVGTPGQISFSALAAARRQRYLIRHKMAAVETLMQSISGAEGKKILIVASRRMGRYAGVEYFGGPVPSQYQQELDTTDYRRSMMRTANSHGITIYPVHVEGLRWSIDGAAIAGNKRFAMTHAQTTSRFGLDNEVLMNETNALQEVALATGGVTAWGSASIAGILPRISEDLDAYYSIGYRATATGLDSTRAIVVKTKNPAYRVRARKQFVEKSEETQMKDRVAANLFQRVPGSSVGIPFDVTVASMKKTGKNRWSVLLNVQVPLSSLTTQPRGSDAAGEFSVYIAAGGALGIMSEVERRAQTFEIKSGTPAPAANAYFTYQFTLNIDQVADRFSVGVLDEIGKEYALKRYPLPRG